MSEENENIERDEEFENNGSEDQLENVIQISGMYREWFLDYASYVILERAVPHINDGLKPVQRRILHSLREMDDGRYHKVANVIGNTMKFHPHGDASIGDAMVQIGQKEILLDMQGNWGNIYTGDRAAAPRYIEVRLNSFAKEVAFNHKTTNWLASYDGRNKEPETLPMKFPLLLAQGVEGIAVGLACKILPHNFVELIEGSIDILRGKNPKILPDFLTYGMADFSDYNDGKRGGKVKVRARIKKIDNVTLAITEIPFSTTTTSLIDSILKANDKGKIKIRKVEDNTAAEVEIMIHLPKGVSPDKMIDALYAFTSCEVSISPNTTVIENDQPKFLGVTDILKASTENTRNLLKLELEIEKAELEEKWHFASLEKIFIENRIYRDIEECETWEAIITTIHKGLKPYIKHLIREVTDEDVARLTEIRIKRISKFDSFKADERIASLEDDIERVKKHLAALTDYAIAYFKNLKDKYGKGKERRTEIMSFDNIDARKVAVSNAKLYGNFTEGFIGTGLKRSESEFICDCSDIDDIIVFRKDGKMMVSKVSSKAFFGKNIIHAQVWKKGDKRTIFNMIYQDGKTGPSRMKRFPVNSITRDKEYDLTKGTEGSRVFYFTANPNGEAGLVTVYLKPAAKVKKTKFDLDLADLDIKGRAAGGNLVTKHQIKKVELKEAGVSTLGARKIWYDETVRRLNSDNRGELLGEFRPEDKILVVLASGKYKIQGFDLSSRFDDDMIFLEKFIPEKPMSAVYYDGDKDSWFVKRFMVEASKNTVIFISDSEGSKLGLATTNHFPVAEIRYNKKFKKTRDKDNDYVRIDEFIAVKGLKSIGNKLSNLPITEVFLADPDLEKEKQANEELFEKRNPSTENSTEKDSGQEESQVESTESLKKEEKKETVSKEIELEVENSDSSKEESKIKDEASEQKVKQDPDSIDFEISNDEDDSEGQLGLF